jgi:uncharacterized small protein (DUF1192 family)
MTRGPLSLRTLLFVSVSLGVLAAVLPASAQEAQGDGADLQSVEKQIQDLQKELRRLKAELAKEAKAKQEAAKRAAAAPAAGVVAAAPSNAPLSPGGGAGTAAGVIPATGTAATLAQGTGAPPPAVPQTVPPELAPPPAGGVSVNPVPPPLSDQIPITTVPPPPGSDSLYSASPAILTQMAPGYSLRVGGLALTLGGYVEAPLIYRNHSEVTGINSGFGTAIPLPNTPQYYMSEIRGDARQSRWAALAQGNISDSISVAAYLEGDFLSAPPTANAIQSNSYTPRWRLYYAQIDDADLGLHAAFGEIWSLVVPFKVGMVPRQELIPIDPDAQYVVGFDWNRNFGLRLVKSFDDNAFNVGLAIESPETVYAVGPNGTGAPGLTSYYFPGGPTLFSGTSYTNEVAPDTVLKLTADPGFGGHYEIYGVSRWMQTRTTINGGGQNHVVPAGGVGFTALYSFFDQKLDLYTTEMAGYGIGRYTSSGLPDATIGPNGAAEPLPGATFLLGAIGHPTDSIDLYSYLGREQVGSRYFNAGGKAYGYGNPLYSNVGCDVQLGTPCVANISSATEFTVGGWWRFLEGRNVGVFLVGPQYEYIRRDDFRGQGSAPTVNEQIYILSFRYYPFQ